MDSQPDNIALASPLISISPASPSQAAELGAFSLGRLAKEELRYAWEGSIELMLDCLYRFRFLFCMGHASRQKLSQHPCVVYQPVWWLTVICCAFLLVPGHAFHTLLGNGDRLRPDETVVETRARVGWIYTYSGGYVLFIIVYCAALVHWSLKSEWKGDSTTSCIVACIISVLYLGGDVHLLFQMRNRNTLMMHACVISRICFGISFCFCFVEGYLFLLMRAESINWLNFILDFVFCIFMVVAFVGYTPLLSVRYGEGKAAMAKPRYPPSPVSLVVVGILAVVGPIVMVCTSLSPFEFGLKPLLMVSLPVLFVTTALLIQTCKCFGTTGLTWQLTFATLTALSPSLLVAGSFAIARMRLWDFLAG